MFVSLFVDNLPKVVGIYAAELISLLLKNVTAPVLTSLWARDHFLEVILKGNKPELQWHVKKFQTLEPGLFQLNI